MGDTTVACKNCGNQFTGKYCNQCGEKVYTDHGKTITHFIEEALRFVTHFEGTLFTTIRTIFSSPGKLSLDYCNGIRKKYFKPLPLFMLLVVLYLVFPVFVGLNMPFQYYLAKGSYANKMTAKKTGINVDSIISVVDLVQANTHYTSQNKSYAARLKITDSLIKKSPALTKTEVAFNKKSEKISKILLLILLPLTALVCWILSTRKRRYFFDHLVLSTDINSFYLLFGFFLVPLFLSIIYKVAPMVSGQLTDFGISMFTYSLLGIFSAIAFRRCYGDKWWWQYSKLCW